MQQFDLTAYPAVAENIAKQKRLDAEKLASMQAEAARLTTELADALFTPYVGKRIRDHSRPYLLVRGPVNTWAFKAPGLVPLAESWLIARGPSAKKPLTALTEEQWTEVDRQGGLRPNTPRGWACKVVWEPKVEKLVASLDRTSHDRYGEKSWGAAETAAIGGYVPDVGSQAVVLAQALAEDIGALLVL